MTHSNPSDATLLGFLLGNLEPSEQSALAHRLDSDPELATRLIELQRMLEPLDQDRESYEPAGDLVLRTLATVEDTTLPPENPISLSERDAMTRTDARLQPTWFDLMATSAASIIALAMLFPGILGSREIARKFSCSNNLRVLGNSIAAFADRDSGRHIPRIEPSGQLAFAGVYAVRLNDSHLLNDKSYLWCPSRSNPMLFAMDVPTMEQLHAATGQRLRSFQQNAGGSYAYNLGFIVDGTYLTPRLEGRMNYPLLGDSPGMIDDRINWNVHSGSCINILFEDGHVASVRVEFASVLPDNPYFNREGRQAAGVDRFDGSLGPSPQSPFEWISSK